MSLTNAEKQKRHRARQAAELDRLRRENKELRQQIEELQQAASDAEPPPVKPLRPPTKDEAQAAEKDHLHWTIHRAVHDGASMIENLPWRMRQAIDIEIWHGRKNGIGNSVDHASFREWVEAPSPRGLGVTYDKMCELLERDPEAVAAFKQAWGVD